MHWNSCRAVEEQLNEACSPTVEPKRNVDHDGDDAEQSGTSAHKAQWVFGNLYQCHSGNEDCEHGRIPFGGGYYCSWPLMNNSAEVHHKPPCLRDSE